MRRDGEWWSLKEAVRGRVMILFSTRHTPIVKQLLLGDERGERGQIIGRERTESGERGDATVCVIHGRCLAPR